ncbi:MFS transporter [Rhizobium cremeum]|uniref:MFS transporter n=1 Tax=Rhizobium cremeum TaxID=2813827 RepID=UPI0013AFF15B
MQKHSVSDFLHSGPPSMPILAPPALIFFCNSVLFISLFTRLPNIQAAMQVNKATLGLALLGGALGTVLALPIAGRVNNRFSPRRTAALSLMILSVVTPLLAMVPYAGFVVCFVFFAFIRTMLDVAQNMISTGIEQSSGVKVISRSHGFWSVGLLLGTMASGWAAGQGMTPFAHLAVIGLLVFACALIVLRITPDAMSAQAKSGSAAPVFIRPTRAILLVALMLFGLAIIEGAIYDWGMFLIRERVTTDPARAGLLFAFFTIGMGATRLAGDWLRGIFRPSLLLRASAVLVAVGLGIILNFENEWLAAIALALIGCGVAFNYPLAVSTVISMRSVNSPAENLAALSMVMLVATIGVPPLLGSIAELYGISTSFVAILPLTLLAFLMAPVSEGRGLREDGNIGQEAR